MSRWGSSPPRAVVNFQKTRPNVTQTHEIHQGPYSSNYHGLGADAATTDWTGACTTCGCSDGGAAQKNPPAGAAAKSAATARSSMRGQSKTHVVPSGEAMAGDRRGQRQMAGVG